MRLIRHTLAFALCAWVAGGVIASADQRVLIKTKKPYGAVKQAITQMGGTIAHEFKHANGLVAIIPDGQLDALERTPGVEYVVRDEVVPNPRPREVVHLADGDVITLPAEALPANYHSYNSQLTNVLPLQLDGFQGQGVIVGIIDSGVSRTASALCSTVPCTAASTRVVGGESFVPGEPDATAPTNGAHGTWVATMIGANRAFGFSRTSVLATAVRNYCNPVSVLPCSFAATPTVDGIWMVGQAPAARFFALKVFPASGAGAPTSRILQAMDRAIELKNTTLPDMKVVNMSLGGPTMFAGRDFEDELATSMAASGISLVVSSGNAGPSGSTVGSPGTAQHVLTVGAASSPVHERILRDLQFGTGIGLQFRPDSNQQMADFSSRGPNADGRIDPEVVANGLASFAQGANGGISLVSGTSFAAPTVAGVAAALYSYKPAATPAEIRAAIIASARPDLIPTAVAVDQGAGYVNAAGARDLLDAGVASIGDPGPAKKKVSQNVHIGAGIAPIESSNYVTTLANLRPAERREFYYVVKKGTAAVRVTLSNITPALPPAQQNAFFGDDIQYAVHSAKTSAIGEGDYLAAGFTSADRTLLFEKPETGLMRITVLGDWTNVGTVSTDVRIEEIKEPLPRHTFKGDLVEGELKVHQVDIPLGTTSVTFRLSWDSDWGAYPTNDIDLILVPPGGGPAIFTGATIDSPETVTIPSPTPGVWTLLVDGFTIAAASEKYQLRVHYE
jgi:subtilisin family serine protease